MLKRLGRDVVIYGSADFFFRATQFLVLPIYAQVLSVSDFGILALLTVSAALLGMILNLGVNNAVQRFYFDPEICDNDRALLVSTGFAQLIVSAIISVGLALVLLSGFGDELQRDYDVRPALALLALVTVVPEQLNQYMQDVLRLHFSPLRFFVVALVRGLFGVIIGMWLLLELDMGITGILLGTLIGSSSAVPIGLYMIRDELRWNFDWSLTRKLFNYGYPFVFAAAAYWVFGSLDRWMLLEFTDLVQVGLFSIGMKFAAIISFISFAFNRAWTPFAFRLFGNDVNYGLLIARVFSAWFMLLALTGLTLALFSIEALQLLTPPEYWGAAPVLAIASAGAVLEGTTLFTVMGISFEKRTSLLTYGAWLAAVANVGLNLLLIPSLGAVGAAIATVFAYGLLTGSFLYWSQRLHPIPIEKGKLLYCCGVVATSLLAPPLLQQIAVGHSALALKLGILLGILIGAVGIGILNPRSIKAMFTTRVPDSE